jgi:hypothetical protein
MYSPPSFAGERSAANTALIIINDTAIVINATAILIRINNRFLTMITSLIYAVI